MGANGQAMDGKKQVLGNALHASLIEIAETRFASVAALLVGGYT